MGRVVFMCGAAGAGKTTWARHLETGDGFARLSIDEEAWARGHRTMPLPADAAEAIEAGLRDRLLELVDGGQNVVLDFSFWSRQMRDRWRNWLAPTAVVPETAYLATDRKTALARVRGRVSPGPAAFQVSEPLAGAYFDAIEPPDPHEGPLRVVNYPPAPPKGPPDAKA